LVDSPITWHGGAKVPITDWAKLGGFYGENKAGIEMGAGQNLIPSFFPWYIQGTHSWTLFSARQALEGLQQWLEGAGGTPAGGAVEAAVGPVRRAAGSSPDEAA